MATTIHRIVGPIVAAALITTRVLGDRALGFRPTRSVAAAVTQTAATATTSDDVELQPVDASQFQGDLPRGRRATDCGNITATPRSESVYWAN